MNFAALVLTLTAAASGNSSAACLPPPPPCDALRDTTLVLLADVLETGYGELLAGNPLRPQTARLKVIERLKGIQKENDEITATIWFDSNSVMLEAGKQFLVYANPLKGLPAVWSTGCSRTKPLSDSGGELEQLRQCVKR